MKPLLLILWFTSIMYANSVVAQHTGSTDIHDSIGLKAAPVTRPASTVAAPKKVPRSRVSAHDLMRSPKEKMKEQLMKAYACAHHPHLVVDKPGRCVECGKLLNRTSKEKMKMEVMGAYTCTRHPHVASKKYGDCSECGKVLIPVKKWQNSPVKLQTTCVNRLKSGKCRSCGSDPMRSPKEKMKMDVMKICCCAANQPPA